MSLVTRRRLLMLDKPGSIPSDYQAVEYIEGTGVQCINTLFYPNQDTSVELDYQMTILIDNVTNSNALFGVYTTGVSIYTARISAGYIQYYYSSSSGGRFAHRNDKDRHIIKTDKQSIFLDDLLIGTNSEASFSCTRPLSLLAQAGLSSFSRFASARVYGCRIYDGERLVRDFVPCYRKSDNVVGLYDTENGVFYENAGEGEFIKGDDVNVL